MNHKQNQVSINGDQCKSIKMNLCVLRRYLSRSCTWTLLTMLSTMILSLQKLVEMNITLLIFGLLKHKKRMYTGLKRDNY